MYLLYFNTERTVLLIAQVFEFVFEGGIDVGWNHTGNIAAQRGNFAHGAGREEGVFLRSDQSDALDIGSHTVVGESHAELELEIGEDAQATHDNLGDRKSVV